MLVTLDTFFESLQKLCDENYIAIDTETTGLKPYHDDKLFCIVAATSKDNFYFNFHPEHPECLPREYIRHFSRISGNVCKTVFMANAKFDMAMLARDGVTNWQCNVHDVLAIQRLIQSDAIKWNLALVAKYYGFEKSEAVENYITEHHLWEWTHIPGKKTREKNKFFAKVPFPLMFDYALKDSRVTFATGLLQLRDWNKFKTTWGVSARRLRDPLEIEMQTTKACYNAEKRGILIDEKLCATQSELHEKNYKACQLEFFDLTGKKLTDSAKTLAPIFTAMGFVLPKTEKGHDSITDNWLAKNDSRISTLVRGYRENSKLANTYYKAFLWHKDSKGTIHADIRQGGTRTGRFSYGVPNLQNIPRDGEAKKAFIPREGFSLVSLDYDQQEYRMMLDYAGEQEVIDAVLGGLDVHTATAQMMGVERDPAKTLNFLLLYGGGIVKLATTLYKLPYAEGLTWDVFWLWKNREDKVINVEQAKTMYQEILPFLERAQDLRDLYFAKLPKVSKFIKDVQLAAKKNKRILTWTGRPIHFRNRNFCYKAPNALIQGGCSDVGKIALIELDRYLASRKSKLLVLVHDDNLFEVHNSELDIVGDLKKIMESIYPFRRLPLTASVSWSAESWGDLVDGMPFVEAKGITLQRESDRKIEVATSLVYQNPGSSA